MRCECCDYTDSPYQSYYHQSILGSNRYNKRNTIRKREPDGAFICDSCYVETIDANKEFDDEYTRSVEEFFS